MRRKVYGIVVLVTLAVVMVACQKGKNPESTQKSKKIEEKTEMPAVCIWDKGSVRQEASKNGKWISSMALGEKVVWTGEVFTDSTDDNRSYYHVRLSDGTEGWVSEYVVAIHAVPGILIKKAQIFRRPDLITVTEKVFEKMSFVAILEEKDDWIQVTGEENKKKGWIRTAAISTKDEDITVGLLVAKAKEDKDPVKYQEKLNEIMNNPLFANSVFVEQLKNADSENAQDESDFVETDSSE